MGAAFELHLCHARHGRMLVESSDTVIGRAVALYGEFAESVPRLLCSALSPGDIALDVGANIGTVALALAAAVGPTGVVCAFEPQRGAFALLATNAALNGLVQLRPVRAAVGAAAGILHAPLPEGVKGINQGAVALGDGDGDPVPVLTLDSLDLPDCRVIKIDVEGMEAAVLQGAAALVARCRPILHLEAHGGPGTEACLRWLAAAGYACFWHPSPFWEPGNHAGRTDNQFGSTGDVNVLALPVEMGNAIDLPPVSAADASWLADIEAWTVKARSRHGPG